MLNPRYVQVLLYGLEVLQLNKSQISSIGFVTNRFFMKMFNTNNIEIVKCCLQEAESRNSVSVYQVSLWLAAPKLFRQN